MAGELVQNLTRPVAGTFMGSGKVEELKLLCEELGASSVIFDHDLSPKQISNIEQIIGRKVIDRSELILDIFAARATTREAQLQVELAQLEYTYPRLKAMWDHLERIVGRGGIGGIGTRGPGEQQLEIDRRLVQRRKLALQDDLREIQARRQREVQARKADNFTVGIVGYTNAGKSTLFNSLTRGGAYADDRLFATLMTRTRQWDLGGGLKVMLSDTVGFVRDIPHHLVASFKATLEEATNADLLLIVVDVSDPAAEMQMKTVHSVLDDLFEEHGTPAPQQPRRVLLLNKVDQLRDNASLVVWQRKNPDSLPISALPPNISARQADAASEEQHVPAAPLGTDRPPPIARGYEPLAALVLDAARGAVREYRITVPLSDAKTISIIENRGQVLERDYSDSAVTLRAKLGEKQLAMLRSAGARISALADEHGQAIRPPTLRPEKARQGWSREPS